MAQTQKIIALGIGAMLLLSACGDALGDRYTGFAQCLTEKGAKMYGVYWCHACEAQKKMFGEAAFEKINYIECDSRGKNAKKELCDKKNIRSTPTWEFADGDMLVGVRDLSVLAEKTKCELPMPPPDPSAS